MLKLSIISLLIAVYTVSSSEPKANLFHRRILSEKHASEKQFPYMVAIRPSERPFHIGGGVLISVNFVLTAASVVASFEVPQNLEMVLGTVDIGKNTPNPGWVVRAYMIHNHPEFKPKRFEHK